jgi:hypothetical protein
MATGKLYQIVEAKVPQKLGPQPSLIVRTMLDANGGMTVKQIADRIKHKLVTRQDPERVVNFYMSVWKKKGIVTVTGEAAAETPVSTGSSVETIGAGDIATVSAEDLVGPQGDANQPDPEKYDYSKGSLKDAILQSLKEQGGGTALDIHHNLQVAGRACSPKGVADALVKMLKADLLAKDEDGRVSLPDHVHA